MDGNGNNLEFLDVLTITSFVMQIINFQENQQQSNNDDIMSELQKQNREYLEKITENQNKILEILEKSNSPNG